MAAIVSPKFKVGDQVQLVSGSPTMTVSRLHTSSDFSTGAPMFFGIVTCTWFEGSKPASLNINQDALVSV